MIERKEKEERKKERNERSLKERWMIEAYFL